ncbi:MAG: T9SS type A sorting domain-containing protein, partial [Bacteroidales bacterium]|nr:T9SS type A sorting domain-containing protein [Bacteroidales bacterium]
LNGVLPEEIGNLNEIEKLVISNNPNLSGILPNTIGQLLNLLGIGIGDCSLLEFLKLPQNSLTGPIPPELGNCDNLWELLLNDNLLSGTIPAELTGLTKLYRLYLQNNQLAGSLPENFCEFFLDPDDFSLSVSNNKLGDSLPESWGNLNLIIGSLDISGNHFTYIPPVTSNCHWEGTYLHIEENKLPYEYIEPHYQYDAFFYFYYYPQQFLLEEIDTLLPLGSNYWIYSGTQGEFTYYEWRHNGIVIGEGPDLDTLFLENISYNDTGIYYCQATNSLLGSMTLRRNEVHIGIDTGSNIINRSSQKSLRVYPNPANEKITIEIPDKNRLVDIKIYNINGRCVSEKKLNLYSNTKIKLATEELKPGIYLLQAKTENTGYTTKLIISKRGINR